MCAFGLKRFVFVCLFLTSATVTVAQSEVDEFDFEMILAGIKHYNDLVQSGVGKGVLTWDQTPFQKPRSGKKRWCSIGSISSFLIEIKYTWYLKKVFHGATYTIRKQPLSRPQPASGKSCLTATGSLSTTHFGQTLNWRS